MCAYICSIVLSHALKDAVQQDLPNSLVVADLGSLLHMVLYTLLSMAISCHHAVVVRINE